MWTNSSITSFFRQASKCNLQLLILSLWGIRLVIPEASIYLGVIPNLICQQRVGLRTPILYDLVSSIPGRSGLFTTSELWLSSVAFPRPKVAEAVVVHANGEQGQRCLRMLLRFSIGVRRGLSRMTECLADLAGKPTQMWGWDGCCSAEGGCKWWMVVVRRGNCVQVIDPAPSFFALLTVSQALHLSFTAVSQMGENIGTGDRAPTLGSPNCLGFSGF